MTDDDLDPRDDLASAHLDGETSPAEADAVAADPELVGRVAAFAEAQDAVRAAGGPVDEARREAAIAAALDAYDDDGAGVTSLATRRRPSPRWLPAVGVAAAALLLALVIPLLTRDDGGEEDTTAAGEAATTTAVPSGDAYRAGADAAGESAPAPSAAADRQTLEAAAPVAVADLGDQADLDALRAAVRARLATPPTTVPGTPAVTPSEEAQVCFANLQEAAVAAGDSIVLQVVAVVDDAPVAAVVRATPEGAETLAVVGLPDCGPVAIVPL